MPDAMDTLKNILGDGAEDKIKNVMNSLSASDGGADDNDIEHNSIDTNSLDQIMQLKNLMQGMTTNRDDPRTNLLLSLKPYMRESRRNSIDSAVKLLGLTNVTKFLKK